MSKTEGAKAPNMNDYYRVAFSVSPANTDACDLLAAFLADAGYESFEQDEDMPGATMTAYVAAPIFDADATAAAVAELPFDVEVAFSHEFVPGQDWNSEWERHYFKPIVVGGKVVVHSSFHTDVPSADYDIVIDPRMAFGTGHHATTTLMMQFILGHDMCNAKVVDMGTGTGILAILSCMCGAAEVLAIELAPAAAENAVDNVALNLADKAGIVKVFEGDASLLPAGFGADYLLANINRNIITADIARYAAALRQGGLIAVSGFYVADRQVVRAAAEAAGLEFVEAGELDDWSSMVFVKR